MTLELWSGNIPADATDIVGERIARIVKRAQKHSFPAPSLVLGEPFFEVSPEGQGIQMVPASIVADGALKLGDYAFIGTVSALGNGEPFVTYAPGAARLPGIESTLEVNYCGHCQTVRDRKDTYLVSTADNDGVVQVGSSCIKDFLGYDPAIIVGWLDAIEHLSISDDEITGWTRSATRYYEVVDILDMASRLVSKRGYVSKQKAEDENSSSTGELLRGWLSTGNRRSIEDNYPVTVESATLFNATVDAIRGSDGANEWESDIVRLFNAGAVQWRHVGILGSAVILGLRTQERKAVADKGESNFIGSVGERLEFSDVRVTLKRGYDGQFGQSFVIRMSVNESDDLLWFASWSETTNALNEGDILTLVGTVKGHELDKRSERPTTVLTRCIVKGRVPAAA